MAAIFTKYFLWFLDPNETVIFYSYQVDVASKNLSWSSQELFHLNNAIAHWYSDAKSRFYKRSSWKSATAKQKAIFSLIVTLSKNGLVSRI